MKNDRWKREVGLKTRRQRDVMRCIRPTFVLVTLQDGLGRLVAAVVVAVDVFVAVVSRDRKHGFVRRVDVEARRLQLTVLHEHGQSALVPAQPLEQTRLDVDGSLQTEALHDACRSLDAAQRRRRVHVVDRNVHVLQSISFKININSQYHARQD